MQRRTFVIAGGFIASLAAAHLLKPHQQAAHRDIKLNTLVPEHFGAWAPNPEQAKLIVSPAVQAFIDNLYSDTLSRTYTDRKTGISVMLSLAYGATQSRSLRVHKPETCYTAQGYAITRTQSRTLSIGMARPVPALTLTGRNRSRVEHITYWIRTGDDIVRGWFEQNISTIRYGLSGHIPDGILVRVSTIESPNTRDIDHFEIHQEFLRDLLAASDHDTRVLLVGHELAN